MSDPCHDFHELMTDALDGRLEAADRDRFERLLAESPDRRREWDAYREMRELLLQVGTEMDYTAVEMGSEFMFNNPNQKSSCGCGQSFNV